ncbi:MAG TPA: hypothetical protein VJG31_02415 [Candidatus Nanoarchaeia archaeon]|nr:hypothetical protein [Candidatus Nanoarchaeia archaeon]
MDDPKKNLIVSGEANILKTGTGQAISSQSSVVVSAMEARTQVIPIQGISKYRTLDDLMEHWGYPLDMRAQCEAMCKNYLPDEESLRKCVELMAYVAENDYSKERFPDMAPHLPAVFSLPAEEQESILNGLKENIETGKVFSAYRGILETHEEAVRARVYSGLNRFGLNQSELDYQYIWDSLNSVFAGYNFLQNLSAEDQSESQEIARRLDFLEQIGPHYLEMAGEVTFHLVEEKPAEAKAIVRRIASEYNTFHDEKSLEEVFERVRQYTLKELEKRGKKAREKREKDELAPERPPVPEEKDVSDVLREELTKKEKEIGSLQDLLNNSERARDELSQEKLDLMQTYKDHVSGEVHTDVLDAIKRQANDSAEEVRALREQYANYLSPDAQRTIIQEAVNKEKQAVKTLYGDHISSAEYQKREKEWTATKKKLGAAVEEARKASAPSGTGRWKLAAALGALGASLVTGGILYFSEARNPNLKGQIKNLTDEKHDYSLLVKRLVEERTGYQTLTEGYETRIADGELISVEDALPSEPTTAEPNLVLGYLTPEEAGGQLRYVVEYALDLEDTNARLETKNKTLEEEKNSLNNELSNSQMQSRTFDESNLNLQKENEGLTKKVEFYETKDLCLQFRRLVKKKNKAGANEFGMTFANNYFGGCRTLSLEEFAGNICYMYQTEKDYSQIKKEMISDLAATFGFDPAKPVRLCPKK